VLLICAAVSVLVMVGFAVVAKTTNVAMRRLALEPWSVLLFFGIADDRDDEAAARRRRLRVVAPRHRDLPRHPL
jgi:hypothetical protein